MPRLEFCGYYWSVSSDELALPTVCSALFRLFWCCCLTAILVHTSNSLAGCSQGYLIISYLSTSLLAFVITIAVEVAMIIESMEGTPSQTELRKKIPTYLAIHLFLGIFQIFCAVMGFVILLSRSVSCTDRVLGAWTTALLFAVVISQVVDVVTTICCCSLFRSFRVDASLANSGGAHVEQVEKWQQMCKSMCRCFQRCTCNLFGGTHIPEDMEAVARVFAETFNHEGLLDLVPSDIAMGIVLLKHVQQAREYERRAVLLNDTLSLPISDVEVGAVHNHSPNPR